MLKKIITHRNKSFSIGEYIARLFAVIVIMFACMHVFANNKTPVNSLIWSSVAFLILTIAATVILLRDTKWVWFFVTAYLVKLTIGIVHYLYFIDPRYFLSSGMEMMEYDEFQTVYFYFRSFVDLKSSNGIFYMDLHSGLSHDQLWNLIAIPFVYFGSFLLTISPIQSFLSNLFAINLIIIYMRMRNHSTSELMKARNYVSNKSIFIYTNKQKSLKFIAILSAYFPLFLISSRFWRDTTGMTLISIGITLIILSKSITTKLLMMIIACYLFYLQRTPYPIALVLAFLLNNMTHRNFRSAKMEYLSKLLLIVFVIAMIPWIISLTVSETNENYLMQAISVSPILYPIKYLLGLIGPFPWNQFLTNHQFSYQLEEYLMGTLNIAIFVVILTHLKLLFDKRKLNLVNLSGLFLFFIGILSNQMYITYVSVGIPFLFGWISTVVSPNQFVKIFFVSFFALISLNIIVLVFVGNLSIGNLWK